MNGQVSGEKRRCQLLLAIRSCSGRVPMASDLTKLFFFLMAFCRYFCSKLSHQKKRTEGIGNPSVRLGQFLANLTGLPWSEEQVPQVSKGWGGVMIC